MMRQKQTLDLGHQAVFINLSRVSFELHQHDRVPGDAIEPRRIGPYVVADVRVSPFTRRWHFTVRLVTESLPQSRQERNAGAMNRSIWQSTGSPEWKRLPRQLKSQQLAVDAIYQAVRH